MNANFRLNCRRWSAATVVVTATVALTLLLAFLVVACGSGGGGSTATAADGSQTTLPPGKGVVDMTNRSFVPATLTVQMGDTVTWVNQDAPQHDVVADHGEFTSQPFDKGQSFTFTFAKAGTYPYHCSIHPGMTGTVIVQ
jgi:plastocyanin